MQSTRVTSTGDMGGVHMIKPSNFASSCALSVSVWNHQHVQVKVELELMGTLRS